MEIFKNTIKFLIDRNMISKKFSARVIEWDNLTRSMKT